jgi:2-polyprenyl-3-methyl-5-hydroxy-6-metoxy-1,4-benzoquinol methylase
MQVNCPICGANTRFSRKVRDDRYGYPGQYDLLECENCRHRFIEGEFTPAMLQDMYSNYYPRSTYDIETYTPYVKKNKFTGWLDGEMQAPFMWIAPGTNVLDVGCGFGQSLGYLQAKQCNAYGVEADENIRRVAEKFGYKVHVGLFDPSLYENDFFDFVTLGQVIEHVTNPLETMRGIASVLKPGGIVVLSTPNADGWGARLFGKFWVSWHAPYHLHFFTRESMQKVADDAGLELCSIKSVTPSDWLYNQWLHMVTIPRSDTPSIYWSLKGRWKPWQTLFRVLFDICLRLKVNHVITRFFDIIGAGDNRLYFLRKP